MWRYVTWCAGALGDNEEKGDKKEMTEEEEAELAEARREEEEKRAEKYRKMEEERETMRQGIRDKVWQSTYLLIVTGIAWVLLIEDYLMRNTIRESAAAVVVVLVAVVKVGRKVVELSSWARWNCPTPYCVLGPQLLLILARTLFCVL